jgi:hypothetical protein
MMSLFSRKPTRFVLVERSRIGLYPSSKPEPMPLTEDLTRYLEVKDPVRLTAAVRSFALRNNLRGQRVLLMLDKNIVFQKAVPVVADVDPNIAKADFESKVPFNPEERQVLSMVQKERQFLFGVNQAFYRVLVDALEASGVKVMAVTPAIVYGVMDAEKLTSSKLDQISDAASLTHAADFLGNA